MALYKRPNSKYWWFKFHFDGGLIQRSTQVSNKRDALTIESAYRTQLALGKIGIEPKRDAPKFDQAVADFLLRVKAEHGESKSTYRRYYYTCECLKRFFGKVKVDRIETKDIEKFIDWRSGQTSKKTSEPVTRKTVNFDLFVLKMILRRLAEKKILPNNPASQIKQLTEAANTFHVISPEEEKLYLMACPQPLQDVAALMLETGMRCGEVYQLNRDDVLIEKGYLKVVKGKTRSSVRRVHLSDAAKTLLVRRIENSEGELLFPRKNTGGRGAIYNLSLPHLKVIGKLGFSFRLYDCRHTFATRALESGVDLLTLASILGHANLKMVSRYAHPSENHKADAIKLMEKLKRKNKSKSSLKAKIAAG